MSRTRRFCIAVALIAMVSLSVLGAAFAESTWMGDGAWIETWTNSSPAGWYAKTVDTASYLRYRVFTHIRGWGGADFALKDEAVSDCYHCSTTLGTGDNAIANFWHYAVTLHKSRLQITSTEYAGYTSHDGSHSSYGCWATYC